MGGIGERGEWEEGRRKGSKLISYSHAHINTATSRGLKPYIELNLICPSPTTRQKRKFKTRQKTTSSPSFNETFQL